MSNPSPTILNPFTTARSGVPLRASGKNESSVTLTIPTASGRGKPRVRPRSLQNTGEAITGAVDRSWTIPGYGSDVALRCAYTDLDGTLLGRGGSLFRDPDGEFSMMQARGLEACHRAGVEVVLKSGRREPQVMEDARLIGQRSYIYEAGCAVVIDGERTLIVGDLEHSEENTIAQQMLDAGVPQLLFERYRGRLEYHTPWHTDRLYSHLFRGLIDLDDANVLLTEQGHTELRLLDNGAIGRPMENLPVTHVYHLVPRTASKARAVEIHMRARGYGPEECIALGDSVEDLDVAAVVGRFFVPANGPERDPGLRDAIAGLGNVTVTEGRMGDGFYEAVVSTLAERG
jgi:hydroxymethylpyrimidine pyrophosphatase-like HAD family hydrolase